MPRPSSNAAHIESFLKRRPDGATIEEIHKALTRSRRQEVLRHSVRAAIYSHPDLFDRVEGRRATYKLKR